MILQVTDNTFDLDLSLKLRVSNDVINEQYIRYFDNDGFELSFLEQEYYRENNIKLSSQLNHPCCQKEWFICKDERFKVDHSLLLQRYYFVGEAELQLLSKKEKFPQLNKYLRLKPKWGLDFALEFYDNNHAIEVIHIEMDYNNYYAALEAKAKLEEKILNTDWYHFTDSLKFKKLQWQHLPGMEQNDWKARHWGLNKAEFTQKAFQ